MTPVLRLALMMLALPTLAFGDETPRDPAATGNPDAIYAAQVAEQIGRCWNLGAFQSSAPPVTVTVEVTMSHSGAPGTIRFISSPHPPSASVTKSYEAARRAILRCGQGGFDLPADDRAVWRTLEITFDPHDMRIE